MRTIRVGTIEEAEFTLNGIRERLKDPTPLLKQIGALGVSRAQRAFEDQRLGEFAWEPRYPLQTAPFINIAGAISDLNAGGQIKGRRFDRRPAGRDTGALQQSVAFRLLGDSGVEWGSVEPYASRVQSGGKSILPVTEKAKKGIRKFLGTKAKPGKGWKYRDKLGWLLNQTLDVQELETDVVARPYVGITADMETEIVEITEDFAAGEAG